MTERRGKHHRRRAWTRWVDQYIDALYTPLGQRAAKMAFVAIALLAVNVLLIVWIVLHVAL